MQNRAILSRWEIEAEDFDQDAKPRAIGDFELEPDQVAELNELGYNIYFFPNTPSVNPGRFFEAADIDTFNYVFVDMDLKDFESKNVKRAHSYATKDDFYAALGEFPLAPTRIVDSGNGVHAYWKVAELDAMSFLRFQRRLCRHLRTDDAVAKLNQLMRVSGTMNTKNPDRDQWVPCVEIFASDVEYTLEDMDRAVERITKEDEEYCQRTYDSAFNPQAMNEMVDELPKRWFAFAKKGTEAHRLFYGQPKDRSIADFRLAHLMLGDGFSREEALSVLANTSKASERSSTHRFNYADNILNKMWEEKAAEKKEKLGYTVEELLEDDDEEFDGIPFRCDEKFDATKCGFRLGHVVGLVGGPGSGKTATSLNIFYDFVVNNPSYTHVIFTLEQPKKEIAKRWRKICSQNPNAKSFYAKVVIVDNYNDDGTHRMLSLDDCNAYIAELQEEGTDVGAVMIDHIGILKQETENGEREGLIQICQRMKAVAINRNILLIMQSQTSREKAKGGDVELNQDAAYGTTNFEWFVDWLITIWQPLRRIYGEAPHMTVTCFKYCKIRHKHPTDKLKENTVYALMFDPAIERLRRLKADEKETYDYWASRANTERNRDRNTDSAAVNDITWAAQPRSKDG